MAISKNKSPINLQGRKIASNEKPSFSAASQAVTFLIGSVKEVDIDRQKMRIDFRDNQGMGRYVNITQPFAGTRSFIQATPEIESLVLLAQQNGEFYPIAYLPSYVNGLENRNVNVWPDEIKYQNVNELFYRVRKLKEGWIALGSADGIEMTLGDKFKVDDSDGNSFIIRPDDHSIISTSINNYVFCSGIWRSAGIVRRNSISPIDLDDIPNAFKDTTINSRDSYVIRPQNSDNTSDPHLIEYRLEVDDRDFNIKPINDVNGNTNKTLRKPIAIFTLGNYIGNDPNDGSYGRVLRPVVFTDPDDMIGNFSLEPVSGGGLDNYAAAITLFKPNRTSPSLGTFIGVDKEGHLFQFIPSATGGGLGKGRSMSTLAHGSLKEVWGQDSRYANSWDLSTSGGIRWNIGTHNERDGNPYSSRSIDIRTSRSVFYMHGSELSPDIYDIDDEKKKIESTRKYFKIEKIGGNERVEVESTREVIVKGVDKLVVKGAKVEKISGAKTVNIGTGYNIIVGDAFTEKVTKEKNESFGNRKTTILKGNCELVVDAANGNISEKITKIGNRTLEIGTGNISEQIKTSGNRTFQTRSGAIEFKTLNGDITVKTTRGNANMTANAGQVQLEARLDIGIKTTKAANVNITGGAINLNGRLGNNGGVITSITHHDYITGAPLKGSSTVKASM